MNGDDGYAVLSGLEEDADMVVGAAKSNADVAVAVRSATEEVSKVGDAVSGMRSEVSRAIRDLGASVKGIAESASPISEMQGMLESDRASMSEAVSVLREISASMHAFESLGGTQHPDGTNGGAWAPIDMGALAEGVTGPIVAAIKELSEKRDGEAETQRSAVTSTTRTTSEAASRIGERIDGSFASLSDAFSASMRDLMDAENRRHEESMLRIDAMHSSMSGMDAVQSVLGSAVQVENLLKDALRGGFDVRRMAPQLVSAIGSAFPGVSEGFEHAENMRAIPQEAARQAAARTRPDGSGSRQRSPEEQDAQDVENVEEGVLSALERHDADAKASSAPMSGAFEGIAGEDGEPASRGPGIGRQDERGAGDGRGASLLDRIVEWASGTRLGRSAGDAASAVESVADAAVSISEKPAAAAVPAAESETAAQSVSKAIGTAGAAIGSAVSKALGPITAALTLYEGVQAAQDIAQGLRDVSISQTGDADAVQGASISAQLWMQRAQAVATSSLTDSQAQSIQDALTSSGMRYDDEDFSEAFEFARQMNQRYGVDVTQAARQYVDSVKRGTSTTEQLYKSMDLLADVSDRTGQSFESLQEGYDSAIKGLTDSTGSSSLANAIASAVLDAGGSLSGMSSMTKNMDFISSQPYAAAQYNSELDSIARQYVNGETNENFGSYAEMQAYAEKTGDDRILGAVQYQAASNVVQGNGYGDIAAIMETGNAGATTTTIGRWSLTDLLFGDKSEFTEENRGELAEEIANGIMMLDVVPESDVDVTQSMAMDALGRHFDADGKLGILGNNDVYDFANRLVEEFISLNETSRSMESEIETQQSRQEAISSESGLIDTSTGSDGILSDATAFWSFGTVSENEDETYDYLKGAGGFDTAEENGHFKALYRTDSDGNRHYIPSSFNSPDGNRFMRLIDITSADEYGGGMDFTDDDVTDDETKLMIDALLKGGYIDKDDYNSLSPEVAREITRELSADMSRSVESGESNQFSDYFSSSRDDVTGKINGIVEDMYSYREKNGIDLSTIDDTNMAKDIHGMEAALRNGLSMDVTLSAEGVGNLATAVANCHAKASSDAGTNG